MTHAAVSKNKTLVVFSGDFDKAMASFIIANGAAAMGGQVTMFFTFWGLNLLRRPEYVPVAKTPIEKMVACSMSMDLMGIKKRRRRRRWRGHVPQPGRGGGGEPVYLSSDRFDS